MLKGITVNSQFYKMFMNACRLLRTLGSEVKVTPHPHPCWDCLCQGGLCLCLIIVFFLVVCAVQS